MAKFYCKGAIVKQTISMSLTAVAQVISIDHSGAESGTFDATTLDTETVTMSNGLEYLPTGMSEGGSVDLELFYDPLLAGHQAITDEITKLLPDLDGVPWELTLPDTAKTTAAFTVAGTSFGITVDLADGLKSTVSLKLDQHMTYPT